MCTGLPGLLAMIPEIQDAIRLLSDSIGPQALYLGAVWCHT